MNSRLLPLALLALGLAALAGPVRADSTQANCEVHKDGDRQGGKSGPCTFSQRQGFIDIDLRNGDTISLSPGNGAGHYRDQNGNKVKRTSADEQGMTLAWENGKKIKVTWSHASGYGHTSRNDGNGGLSHGDYGINRLDDGQFEVVWSKPYCIVLIGADRNVHKTTAECTDQQIARSRDIGRRGH